MESTSLLRLPLEVPINWHLFGSFLKAGRHAAEVRIAFKMENFLKMATATAE